MDISLESPGLTTGAFFHSLCIGGCRTRRQVRRWSVVNLRCGKPRPVVLLSGGSGRLDDPPLLGRSALQLIENQFAMLLEYAQRRFKRMEHRLSNLRGVASI
jgi:hypothetical protein